MYLCTECNKRYPESEVDYDCPDCGNGLIEGGNDDLEYFIKNERD